MAEWLKAHAWKACLGETPTWVRIPLSPPLSHVNLSESTKYIKTKDLSEGDSFPIFSPFHSNSGFSLENSYQTEKTVPRDELAQLRNVKTLAERVFSIIDRHLPNPNLTSLSRIIPPPTIRRHRRAAITRLIRMERELSYPCDSISEPVASEIEIGGTA